jgi:hypothetical protein
MASPLRFRQVPGACDRVLRLLDDTFRRSHPASEGRNGDAISRKSRRHGDRFMAIKTGHVFMGFKWIDGNGLMEMD